MKQRNLTYLTAFTLLMGSLVSCQNDIPEADNPVRSPHQENGSSKNLAAIRNYLDNVRHTDTRSGAADLTAYVVNGDTVMFVVNYDEGWEVFSNDNRLPMVIMKSETGSFKPDVIDNSNPFEYYFKTVGEDLQAIGIENTDDPEGLWQVYSAPTPNPTDPGTGGQYQMVGMACETTSTVYTPKGGRLSTQWGQYTEPINQYTPFLEDIPTKHSRVGCCAVAAGQFIFFYQRYFNPAMTTVTDAVYNTNTNTYSFSGNSNSVWNLFDDGSDKEMVNDLDRMKPTALFLGHVGVEIYTKYGKFDGDGSSSNEWNISNFINSSCDLNTTISLFNYQKLITNFTSGLPVVGVSTGSVTENNSEKGTGHAYIIDYAETINQKVYEVYAWSQTGVTNPPVITPSDPIDNPYGPTLSYYRAKYGNIDYTHSFTNTERWIKMNWGWHGLNNDVMINADLSSWIINRYSESMSINDELKLNSNWLIGI